MTQRDRLAALLRDADASIEDAEYRGEWFDMLADRLIARGVRVVDEETLARALFEEIGWPTRYPHFNLPDGLRTGDGDNPAWAALAAAILAAIDKL